MQKLSKLKELFKAEKRVRILAALGALGILLLCLSELLPNMHADKKESAQKANMQTDVDDFCTQTEKKLSELIAQVEGAGRVRVMLTIESSDEKIYAADEKTNAKTDGDTEQKSYDSQYVLVDGDSGDTGILLKTNAPKIKGVIIVCDGGENPTVANQITNAVSAALGVGANRVSVLKMKPAEE